jgi:hypothetical protein
MILNKPMFFDLAQQNLKFPNLAAKYERKSYNFI